MCLALGVIGEAAAGEVGYGTKPHPRRCLPGHSAHGGGRGLQHMEFRMLRLVIIALSATLLSLPAAAQGKGGTSGASGSAPGQKQTTPGTAKDFAPGQQQTTPGTAKDFAPGQQPRDQQPTKKK